MGNLRSKVSRLEERTCACFFGMLLEEIAREQQPALTKIHECLQERQQRWAAAGQFDVPTAYREMLVDIERLAPACAERLKQRLRRIQENPWRHPAAPAARARSVTARKGKRVKKGGSPRSNAGG